jgi:D-Tyr-tRNAtyr deacylase
LSTLGSLANTAKNMRITITIDDGLFHTLKIRAAETNENISQFVESAIKYQLLEDLRDIESSVKRVNESVHSLDDLVTQFEVEGLL